MRSVPSASTSRTVFACSRCKPRPIIGGSRSNFRLAAQAAKDDVPGTSTSTAPPAVDVEQAWERLSLVSRQLKVAIADEEYALAAKLRDEQKTLSDSLPPLLQYSLGQVAKLRSGTTAEQLQTIVNLGETGESAVIPDLAACLVNPELADTAEKAMWAIFMRVKDPRISDHMAMGCTYMRSPATYEQALATFTEMIQMAPTFVEGYNKRATVNYLMGRHQASIDDCRAVLQMQPYHFGAASGLGLCLLQMSRFEEALAAFECALAIHPGMSNIRRFVADLKRHAAAEEPEQQRGNKEGKQQGEGAGGVGN